MVQPRFRPLLLRPVLSHASSFFLPSILHSHNRSSTTSGVFHPSSLASFHIFRASLCSILTTVPAAVAFLRRFRVVSRRLATFLASGFQVDADPDYETLDPPPKSTVIPWLQPRIDRVLVFVYINKEFWRRTRECVYIHGFFFWLDASDHGDGGSRIVRGKTRGAVDIFHMSRRSGRKERRKYRNNKWDSLLYLRLTRYMVTCLTCLRIGETSMEEIVGYGFEEDSSGGKRVVEFLLSCSVWLVNESVIVNCANLCNEMGKMPDDEGKILLIGRVEFET